MDANYPMLVLLDILREPFEPVAITHLADDATHKYLERSNVSLGKNNLSLASREIAQTQVKS